MNEIAFTLSRAGESLDPILLSKFLFAVSSIFLTFALFGVIFLCLLKFTRASGEPQLDFAPLVLRNFLIAPESIKGLIRRTGDDVALYVLDQHDTEHRVAGPEDYERTVNLIKTVVGSTAYDALIRDASKPRK